MTTHRTVLLALPIVLMALISSSYAGDTLTLKQAQKGISASFAAAKKNGAFLSCAVVDARGDLVALMKMDNAKFFTPSLAEGKALASAVLGRPSGDAAEMAKLPFFTVLNASFQNKIMALQGAVPITLGKQIIGGIGCSGAAPQFDEEAAKAGLAAIK